ncbi:hypothetical protein THAOC_02782 [Thalassiosira oceanica]|uniref:S-adenosylmethionine-dependent methyltransferase domain-containing protein n=1 Tax=Thalassiosira oceanica TaxID=159749 RepID=K0T9R5_THAOC|nr:hypothetical protein THAOC_02782 [Thalassiosira oceanica]|eukprot:EJK75493.1 hypothetical protein THAOC_02782 [Thalassiosira oceanica]
MWERIACSILALVATVHCFSADTTGRQALSAHPIAGNDVLAQAIESIDLTSTSHVDACRVFHGRGGLHEGYEHLTLDYFRPVFLLTSFKHVSDDEVSSYQAALEEKCHSQGQLLNLVYQCRAQTGNTTTTVLVGEIPNPHIVTESNGANKYIVQLGKHQNHGLFLDMANGRSWLESKCRSGDFSSVLNLFSYTCAFSVAACNGGADLVVNLDMSKGALKVGQRNHEINGVAKRAKFLSHNLFKSWGKLKRLGPFDCVVVDPPSYQKGSFVAEKDYVKVIRRLPSLVAPNGCALLCLNAPELDTVWLKSQVRDAAPELVFVERIPNPPSFESAFPERALKVLLFEYIPAGID